ncbi:probable WRKY transcription factor 2 [Chenopodium quinoa]|uniref:probable WRKY transcription factor 2 n=1 Tax=Chenopodium quinoa TaxID=63459 RepID=UPI000B78018B|nr:probable WRKY transcription factor 2 [Chenopodium quinoa]
MLLMENSEEELEEWRDIMMSSKGIFSGFGPEKCGCKSIDEFLNGGEGSFGCDDGLETSVEKSLKFDNGSNSLMGVDDNSSVIKTGVSIAQRRANKRGLNASKLCSPRVRTNSLWPYSSESCSPYVTVSTNISPRTLLESPMLLPNSQVFSLGYLPSSIWMMLSLLNCCVRKTFIQNDYLSPTTGSFASRPLDGDGQMLISASSVDADKGSDGSSSALFKPHTETTSLSDFHDVNNQCLSLRTLVRVKLDVSSLLSEVNLLGSTPIALPQGGASLSVVLIFCWNNQSCIHDAGPAGSPPDFFFFFFFFLNDLKSCLVYFQSCDSNIVSCFQMLHKNGSSMGDDSRIHDSLDGNQNGIYSHPGTSRTAEDGYNWRKYGQKQVKGSEYPRSYYKCTYPNCPVKKKVERSHDGQITEIIYKNAHNHPKPQPSRKSTLGSLPFNETADLGDGSGLCMKVNNGPVWRSIQSGYKDVTGSDWRIDGLETSPTSALTEVSDPLSTTQGKPMGVLGSAGTPEFSSAMVSHEDDEEDATAQGRFLIEHEGENGSDLKRRKKDGYFAETTLGSRAVREPKVVFETETDADILEDGYRWRKYGQKVVKGNPNPRSYYKCTTPGCTVRKHVERSSRSLRFILVTYEGKHNHEVPAARNSAHANSGSGSLTAAATSTQPSLALPRNSHLPKPEPHAQDLPLHFNTNIGCSNDIFRSKYICNLGAGTPPYYPIKLPALPNTTPYGPFGLSTNHPAYANNMVPAIPELSFPPPLAFPCSIASCCNPDRSHSTVPSLYAGQQLDESDVKFLRPKQEQKDDSFETDMNSFDHTNVSSSTYNHVLGNFGS